MRRLVCLNFFAQVLVPVSKAQAVLKVSETRVCCAENLRQNYDGVVRDRPIKMVPRAGVAITGTGWNKQVGTADGAELVKISSQDDDHASKGDVALC